MLLFTGKGGVGKTSVAAATAVRAARRGDRVLLTSTDPAHSLADAFDVDLGDEPSPVAVGGAGVLKAQQIDAQARLERHWSTIRRYLVGLLSWSGIDRLAAEELVAFPGLDELFALVDLRDQVTSGSYDLVVVDCAPTAETLKLLSLPDQLRWYVSRLTSSGRHLLRAVRPLTASIGDGPIPVPDDEVVDAVDRVHDQLGSVHALLQDASRTSVRLVLNPERLVVAEAARTATTLSLFGYAVDAVIVNRVLPGAISDPYLRGWQDRQAAHLRTVEELFAPLPTLEVPLLPDEPVGADALLPIADAAYGERDERAVLHGGRPVELVAEATGHVLRLALPNATRDDVDLHRRGDDLHVRVAGVRRTIPLPAVVQRADVVGAGLVDGWLEIRLAPPATVGAS